MKDRRTKGTLVSTARWAGYAAAGAATAAIADQRAEAINYTPLNVSLTGNSNFLFNLQGSASIYFRHAVNGAVTLGAAFCAMNNGTIAGTTSTFWYASNLGVGTRLSGLANWLPGSTSLASMANGNGFPNSNFTAAGVGYVGFKFTQVDGLHYGWAQVTMGGGPLNNMTINGVAFGGPGQNLVVGQTPAPGCLGMLALGAVGLRGTRRKRAA